MNRSKKRHKKRKKESTRDGGSTSFLGTSNFYDNCTNYGLVLNKVMTSHFLRLLQPHDVKD